MFLFDSTMILLIPGIIIGIIAQGMVSSRYNYFKKVRNRNGYTGEQVARLMLNEAGLYNVKIAYSNAELSDNYNPKSEILTLSKEVAFGSSIAAAGIAAHEVGHAIQHSTSYEPLKVRNSIIPIVNFSSNAWIIMFMLGLFFESQFLAKIGIILFALAMIFQIVTLPVEFNASNRALKILSSRNILYGDELDGAKKVLSAAALTYVAAALMSILQLIRLIVINNRND